MISLVINFMADKQKLLHLNSKKPMESSRSSKKLYKQWRIAELVASIFACFGIAAATADYEYGFSSGRTHDNCREDVKEGYRWLTLTFTLVAAHFLILRHILKSRWNKKKNKKAINKNLIFELALLSIFPYPYLRGGFTISQPLISTQCSDCNPSANLCYTYSEFLYIFMFTRLLLLLRSFFNFTPYQDDHARYYCFKTGTKANVRFSIRCMMKTHPFLLIYCFSCPSFFILGVFLRVFERPFSDISGQNFASYQNSVWNCAVTMSTIGFGDLYPTTVFGRVVGVMCAIMGGFVFSMVVFTFQELLKLGSRQHEAFINLKQTRAAARVIAEGMAFKLVKDRLGEEHPQVLAKRKKIKKKYEKFKVTMKKIQKLSGYGEEENPVIAIQQLSSQVSELENKVNKLLEY